MERMAGAEKGMAGLQCALEASGYQQHPPAPAARLVFDAVPSATGAGTAGVLG